MSLQRKFTFAISSPDEFLVCAGTSGQHTNTHIAVLAGESLTLSCYGDCHSISWWLNSDIIVRWSQLLDTENNTERFNFSCDCSYYDPYIGLYGYRECNLTILDVQTEDSGDYFCYDEMMSLTEYHSRVTVIRKLRKNFKLFSSCVMLY